MLFFPFLLYLSFVVLYILFLFWILSRTAVDYYNNVDACRACSVRPVHSCVEYVKDFTIKLTGKSKSSCLLYYVSYHL